MEPAIFGVLAFILTVMLYLDRSRRNETRDLRQDMHAGFAAAREETAKLREDMHAGFAAAREETAKLREDMHAGFSELRQEIRASAERTDARIDQLNTAVINLAESLGQVKGRTETLVATE